MAFFRQDDRMNRMGFAEFLPKRFPGSLNAPVRQRSSFRIPPILLSCLKTTGNGREVLKIGSETRMKHYLAYFLLISAPAWAEIDFATQIWPIFEANCIKCHGPGEQKAKLRLDSKESILEGSAMGPVIEAGKPNASFLLEAINLPPDDDSFMPKEGQPLPQELRDLLRQWIAEGAPFGEWTAAPATMPADPLDTLAEGLGPAPEAAVAALSGRGVLVMPLAQNNNLLSVNFRYAAETVTDAHLEALAPLAEHVTWLNLAGTAVSDEGLRHVGRLTRLTELRLENTAVTDAGLPYLSGLKHLEYLNLYGTNVTDAGLEHLKPLADLRKLYLWKTKATSAGVEAIKAAIPGIEVNLGTDANQPVASQ
jgi:hypothetical protein